MPKNVTLKGPGFQLTFATGSIMQQVQDAVKAGLQGAGGAYLEKVKETISLDDHTLEELRKMGHPYATREGAPRVHEDDRLVHTQSGHLLNSIKKTEVTQLSGRKYRVNIYSDDPAVQYLIYGTSTMRPRRFHELALQRMEGRIWKPIMSLLKNVKVSISGVNR